MIAKKLKALLAGLLEVLAADSADARGSVFLFYLAAAIVSSGLYGATFGLWRNELQALCTAIKFPLVILLTCGGNALLNGFLGMLFGAGLSVKQSSLLIVMSFAITGIILLGLAPILLFILWNTPPSDNDAAHVGGSVILLSHVCAIAFAGYIGNLRLWQLLRHLTGSVAVARVVLFSWLAVNLLLGSQVSWILRPWIGSPERALTFFAPDPFHGNFFEAVWSAAMTLISPNTDR